MTFDLHSYTIPAKYLSGVVNYVISLFCWVKLSMYRSEFGSLLPFIITFPLPLLRMSTILSSNMAWNPRFKNVPMDRKALLSPGKRCDFRAASGRSCLESRSVCVDVIIYLFGMWMVIGLIASCLLPHGESRVR